MVKKKNKETFLNERLFNKQYHKCLPYSIFKNRVMDHLLHNISNKGKRQIFTYTSQLKVYLS